jgi:hypothetical protein
MRVPITSLRHSLVIRYRNCETRLSKPAEGVGCVRNGPFDPVCRTGVRQIIICRRRVMMATGPALVSDDVAQAGPRTKTAEKASVRPGSGLSRADASRADFVDRQAELERLLQGLGSPAGPHFWRIVAPPGLGKSMLLTFTGKLKAHSPRWEVRSRDARDLDEALASDPAALVADFFGPELDNPSERAATERIAEAVVADGRRYLCLLDSAELLDERAVAGIREYFGEIYNFTGGCAGGKTAGRVALVVASRLDGGWTGLVPAPRFELLSLTALTRDAVAEAVMDLAGRTGKQLDHSEHERATAGLIQISAGVPELMTACLGWIDKTQWRQLDRLPHEDEFRVLAYPFVQNRLLSSESLLPSQSDHGGERRNVIEHALRLLAPYRIFTQSHVQQHLAQGSRLSWELTSVGWSREDLWKAIAGSALLSGPQHDSWYAVQPRIRELLFRYFYETDELRAQAHVQALAFDRIWTQAQAGGDQVAGLAECIWHEASAMHASDPGQVEGRLIKSAKELVKTLRAAGPRQVDDLRHMLANRLRQDTDLSDLLSGAPGALDRLARTVTSA